MGAKHGAVMSLYSSPHAGEDGVHIMFKSKHHDTHYNGSLADDAALGAWAIEECMPLVREITFENGEELTEEGLPFLIMFYEPNKPEQCVRGEQAQACAAADC
jgi:hypothetical protein